MNKEQRNGFNAEGYGFITGEDGNDVSCTFLPLSKERIQNSFDEGQAVTYDLEGALRNAGQ